MKPVGIWEKKEFCSLITWRTSLATGVSAKRKKSMRGKQENLVWAVRNQDFRGRAHLIYPRLVDDVFGIGCISQCAHGLTVASVCRRHGWGRSRKLKHTEPFPPSPWPLILLLSPRLNKTLDEMGSRGPLSEAEHQSQHRTHSTAHSLATMMVLELPPRLSFSSQVNTESR